MATNSGQLINGLMDPNATTQKKTDQPPLGAGAGGANPPVQQDGGASVWGDPPSQQGSGSDTGQMWGDPPPQQGSDGATATGDPPSKQQNGGGLLGAGAGGANPPTPGWGTDTGTQTGPPDDLVGGKDANGPTNPVVDDPTDLYYDPPPDRSSVTSTDTNYQAVDPGRSADKQALVDQLMARMKQGTAVDPNDPNIKQQVDAYAAQADRANRNYLSDQAEANSPYSTGQMANIQRMTAEKEGQDVGGFAAGLVGKELQARRDEIQNALTQMGSTLSDEEKQGLQRDLANLDAAIQQHGQGNQNSQFYAGLSQQDKQFADTLQQNERFKNMDDALARYNTVTQNAQFFAKLAQDKDIAGMQNALEQSKLAQTDKEFLLQLAQTGDYQKAEEEYKRLALSQDQNQFMSKLAQEGNIAQMDDIFRKMQLAQNESQFLDRLGFDTTSQQNYWDWLQRGNAPPAS